MQAAFQQFEANIAQVRALGVIHARLSNATTVILDLSDLLRAQIVLAVSAFDTLIHELVRRGMLEAASGQRPVTDAMHRFNVSFQAAMASSNSAGHAWLDQEIRARHGLQTFQKAEKVADAIRLICPKALWTVVGTKLGMKADDVKRELDLIVDRRNKIAHEADADPTFPGQRWAITPTLASSAVDYLERLGDAIFKTI